MGTTAVVEPPGQFVVFSLVFQVWRRIVSEVNLACEIGRRSGGGVEEDSKRLGAWVV